MMLGKHARNAGYLVCPVCRTVMYSEDSSQHLCGAAECHKIMERMKRFVNNQKEIQDTWREKDIKPNKCIYCDGELKQGYKMRILCDDHRCGLDYSRVKRYIKKYGL